MSSLGLSVYRSRIRLLLRPKCMNCKQYRRYLISCSKGCLGRQGRLPSMVSLACNLSRWGIEGGGIVLSCTLTRRVTLVSPGVGLGNCTRILVQGVGSGLQNSSRLVDAQDLGLGKE